MDVISRCGQSGRHLKELFLVWEKRTGSSGKSADGIEHVGAAIGLAEVGCTTCGHRLFPYFLVVMRSDEDDGRRLGHIRELLAKIKAQGGRVLSRDGALVEWSDTIRNVFVKDPNGLNLELVGSADPNL